MSYTQQDRSWSLIILVVTLAYLGVEVSFSATLLNVVSSQATPADVDHIERWGRLISGFAAGLVLWSVITPKRFGGKLRAFITNVLVTMIVMIVAFQWEKSIVDNAQAHSSGADRKLAVYASFLRDGLINGTVALDGLPSGQGAFADGDGKAFIALSPLLTITQSGMKGKIDDVIRPLVTENIRASIGGSRGFYNNVFLPSANQMVKLWQQYLHMVDGINRSRIMSRGQSKAERDRAMRGSMSIFNKEVADTFSVPGESKAHIDPNTIHDSSDFFHNQVIIRFWAHLIGFDPHAVMMPDDSYEKIRRDVWPKFLEQKVSKQIKEFGANPDQFDDGGPLAQKGKDAIALLTVPALALMLSVLFTLVHTSKVSYYLIRVVTPRMKIMFALPIAIGVSSALIVTFERSVTPITQSSLYTHLLSGYATDGKWIWPAASLTWVTQAERLIYPVADATRRTVLPGFNFGVVETQSGANE